MFTTSFIDLVCLKHTASGSFGALWYFWDGFALHCIAGVQRPDREEPGKSLVHSDFIVKSKPVTIWSNDGSFLRDWGHDGTF